MRAQARGRRAFTLDEPSNRPVEAVPRHTEIPNILANKICRNLGIPEPSSG